MTTSTGSTVHRYAYGYDPAGNRTSNQTDLSVTSGTFSNLNQLQGNTAGGPLRFSGSVNQNSSVTLNGQPATMPSPTQFTGQVNTTSGTNVVTVVAQDTSGMATTNRFQVVTSPGTAQTVGYDLDGNQTSDAAHTYEWDAANRLTAINYTSGGTRSEFTYDGMGRRVKIVEKNSSGSVTNTKKFVFIKASMVEERDVSNATTKQCFPQGMAILSGYSITGNFYYTRDHLGSVRELLDSTGAISSRIGYDPYGNATTLTGTTLPDFQYAGMYMHSPSGLSLTLFRAYDSKTARWLSRDPAGMRFGINLYAYVGDNPVDFFDPMGLCGSGVTLSVGLTAGAQGGIWGLPFLSAGGSGTVSLAVSFGGSFPYVDAGIIGSQSTVTNYTGAGFGGAVNAGGAWGDLRSQQTEPGSPGDKALDLDAGELLGLVGGAHVGDCSASVDFGLGGQSLGGVGLSNNKSNVFSLDAGLAALGNAISGFVDSSAFGDAVDNW